MDSINTPSIERADPVARPKAEIPRPITVLVRLTEPQAAVLDAMVAVERSNRSQITLGVVEAALEEAEQDDIVQAQMQLHAKHDRRVAAKVTNIKRVKSSGP